MGRRRPWILVAQSGMILTLILLTFIASAENDIQVIAVMFLVYNIFTSLQDVSTDALAVDVLKTHELEKVNSYMFTSKAVGGIIGGAGLGTIISFHWNQGCFSNADSDIAGNYDGPIVHERETWKIIPME